MQEPAERSGQAPSWNASRAVQENICQARADRERLRTACEEYVAEESLVGPLPFEELRRHGDHAMRRFGVEERYRDFLTLLINNALWKPRLSEIPFDRRLLLLPKCLRSTEDCRAVVDDFGLVCERCGSCVIHELQEEAEALGYVVMVAEGSPLVTALIESGQVEAVVGVSCLTVLEGVYPYMEAAAVPGIAVPLLKEGCADTFLDLDWIREAMHLRNKGPSRRLILDDLRKEVRTWFEEAPLERILGPAETETEAMARAWLLKSGKRWRPILAACAGQALQEDPSGPLPAGMERLAVAVECFHKASLIHDDIEDGDELRYGEQTLHARYGVPIALNVGDFLLGEGYRLIGTLDLPSAQKALMYQVAAEGHRTLCLGQGDELCWLRRRVPLSVSSVLTIFRRKTAPAFEVALRLGAIHADADAWIGDVLHRYSDALGVAYQIRDDLSDLEEERPTDSRSLKGLRPSLLLALAHEQSSGEDREALADLWQAPDGGAKQGERVIAILEKLEVTRTARMLLEQHKNRAIQALHPLDNPDLKGILHRVIGKIFNDKAFMGCCNDHQRRNAPEGEAVEDAPE